RTAIHAASTRWCSPRHRPRPATPHHGCTGRRWHGSFRRSRERCRSRTRQLRCAWSRRAPPRRWLPRRSWSQDAPGQFFLDALVEHILDLGHLDLLDHFIEEAAHHELAGYLLGDAAGHEVEQVLLIEASRRGGVAGTGDVAGLDLEVRHRVRPRPIGEDEVAVELVGVDVESLGADEHIADPDAARVLALECALVVD